MKIVHAADSHVGFRQYGLEERENDFSDSFREVIDKTLEIGPDVFVHAGDLFHYAKPANKHILEVAQQIKRLMDAGIEVITTPGNHDKKPTRLDIAPQAVLELEGVKVFSYSPDPKPFVIDGVEFWGVPNIPNKNILLDFLQKAGERAKRPAVLVLHQGVQPVFPMAELFEEDIPEVFSYVALGHYHISIVRGRFAYPGCPQVSDVSQQELKNQKRFIYEVDLQEEGFTLRKHLLTTTRPFLSVEAVPETLLEELEKIKQAVLTSSKKPLLVVKLIVRKGYDQSLLAHALAESGLKEAFLKEILQTRLEETPLSRPVDQAQAQQDILQQLLEGEDRALELARIMAKAGLDARAQLETVSRSADKERKQIIEEIIRAAKLYLEESEHEIETTERSELFEPPSN